MNTSLTGRLMSTRAGTIGVGAGAAVIAAVILLVYLNGQELGRPNMAEGVTIGYRTYALGVSEDVQDEIDVPASRPCSRAVRMPAE